MKIKLHIPTEQYGFCEVEVEGEPDYIAEVYAITAKAFRPKPTNSLPDKEFNAFLDRQLMGESNHIEDYEKCSPEQKTIIQAVKRALNRIEAKQKQV